MSEYQYYEFQAIDRPLSAADQTALRAISTRARITATSLTNSYEWGDFKGNTGALMARWFDLHLYLANWGSRVLMIRLPERLVDLRALKALIESIDTANIERTGENLVLHIWRDEIEPEEDWDDGSGWLGALAPLRADILSGDLRLFYLLWLIAVEDGDVPDETTEPLPGLGPLSGALCAFADFFGVDPDLVTVAAEQPGDALSETPIAPGTLRRMVEGLPEAEKTRLLFRLFEGDPHVANEARSMLRVHLGAAVAPSPRTAGELCARAADMRAAREQEQARLREAVQRRKAEEAERARRARLDALKKRGESVWREIEGEIERRNAPGYNRAAQLLHDLGTIAKEQDAMGDFRNRLKDIRERHARKQKFLDRLRDLI